MHERTAWANCRNVNVTREVHVIGLQVGKGDSRNTHRSTVSRTRVKLSSHGMVWSGDVSVTERQLQRL